jgi:hypothetical protein
MRSASKASEGAAVADPTGDAGFPVVDLPAAADTPDAAVRVLLAELVRSGQVPATAAAEVTRQVW